MNIVIVGGVIAGITAATRLRSLVADASITIIERGDKISFANCALPYYAGGLLDDQKLFTQTSDDLRSTYGIAVRERHEVLSIDRSAKKIKARNLVDGTEYYESYDVLILATGAQPRMLPIPGLKENAHPMWRPEDARRLSRELKKWSRPVVGIMGGGAVGLETAENVVRLGGEAHLYEYGSTLMGRNDQALSNLFCTRVTKAGGPSMHLHLETSIKEVGRNDDGSLLLKLSDGTEKTVDYLVSAAGVAPRSELARAAGLELGPRDTILTNAFMQTSDPSIYAVGDVATSTDPITGEERPMMLAGSAVKEARAAADHIAGIDSSLKGGYGANVVSVFDTLWASVGRNEQSLLAAGMKPHKDFHRATIITCSRDSWHKQSNLLVLKVLFAADGRILGAQAIGEDGTDKRIDVLAACIRFNAGVESLGDLDLCYSPQTSTPKDPVNQIGHQAQDILAGRLFFIEPLELREALEKGSIELADGAVESRQLVFIDVRSNKNGNPMPECFACRAEAADCSSVGSMPLEAGSVYVLVSDRGQRAEVAASFIRARGGRAYVLTGGLTYWYWANKLEAKELF